MKVIILRCDLLEKSYLCGINNNYPHRHYLHVKVVICLKSLTFVVSITTTSCFSGYRVSL